MARRVFLGGYLNLTEEEYDQILVAWRQGERMDSPLG
jgi:hypothetical protein